MLIRYHNHDSAFNFPIDTLHYFYGFLGGRFGVEFGITSGSKEDYMMDYSYLISGKNLDKDYRIRDIQMHITDESTKCCEVINEAPVSYTLNETGLMYDEYILINKKP